MSRLRAKRTLPLTVQTAFIRHLLPLHERKLPITGSTQYHRLFIFEQARPDERRTRFKFPMNRIHIAHVSGVNHNTTVKECGLFTASKFVELSLQLILCMSTLCATSELTSELHSELIGVHRAWRVRKCDGDSCVVSDANETFRRAGNNVPKVILQPSLCYLAVLIQTPLKSIFQWASTVAASVSTLLVNGHKGDSDQFQVRRICFLLSGILLTSRIDNSCSTCPRMDELGCCCEIHIFDLWLFWFGCQIQPLCRQTSSDKSHQRFREYYSTS